MYTTAERKKQIESEQSKWINNVLNRNCKSTPIDRLLKKRDISFSSIHDMSPFWQKIYEPMTQNEQAFNEVLNDIDDKEWDTILNSLQRLIRDSFNLVLITGHIPSKWKSSTIIPILKPEKFNYNMDNLRKLLTKTISMRLGKIFTEHNKARQNQSHDEVAQGAAFIEITTSTRAEIYAILLALLTCSNGSIYTDSAAAIQAINEILNAKLKTVLDRNNFLLLYRIFIVVRENNLELELHKVKGHSGDEWNDKAPELANIELVYLPPNTTTHLQPMDADYVKFCT
ncbi:unnamed protein product [Rhizophagus irregularis]|nr:unnamed protein product [Rhizophagus irregularis]